MNKTKSICFATAVLLIYFFIGSYSQVYKHYQIKAMQPKINAMKKTLASDPEKIISALKQAKGSNKAKTILFKIYVGMRNYPEAYKIYSSLQPVTDDAASIFITIVPFLDLTDDEKLKLISSLKNKVDIRLVQFYQAHIMLSQGKCLSAKKLLQATISQVQEQDPMFKIIAEKIRSLHC